MEAPVVADLHEMIEVADQGIVSKTVVENVHHKLVHFTFAPGQELSEHTASVPAAIQVLEKQMRQAAANLEFELAAMLRDQVNELRALSAPDVRRGGQPAQVRRRA